MSQVSSPVVPSPKKRVSAKISASPAAKDDLDNIHVKKRVKLTTTESPAVKVPKTPTYDFPKSTIQDLLKSEDEKLKGVCCNDLRQTFAMEAKSLLADLNEFMENKEGFDGSVDAFHEKCIGRVLKMRYSHRLSMLKTEERNDELLADRASVDKEFRAKEAARVRLFNVRNEIESCLDIRAPEEDCDILPMSEFLEKVPSARLDDDISDKKHLERVARLQWELEERQGLQEKLQELENRRDVLVTDIGGKEQRIASMVPMFEKVRDAAKPLYELMGPSSNADAIAEHCQKFFESLPNVTAGSPHPEEDDETCSASGENTPIPKIEEDAESDTASVTTADDEDAEAPPSRSESALKEEMESDGENGSEVDKEAESGNVSEAEKDC